MPVTDNAKQTTDERDSIATQAGAVSATQPPGKTSDGVASRELYDRAMQTLDAAEAAIAGEQQRDAAAGADAASERGAAIGLAVSVLMPVYNERETLREIVERVQAVGLHTEIVIVDDCSTDGTRDLLIELDAQSDIRVVLQGYNQGKGAALRTAIQHARGDVLLIQDADLEYDPGDYEQLLEPIRRREADVVYGSRFLAGTDSNGRHQDPSWVHRFGNRALTLMSNLTTGLRLTDMETCYKVFRRDALRGMVLRENRFGFEPEITAKLARRKCRFAELPIRYDGRGYEEGKKIGVRDGLRALWCILRYAWVD